MTGKVRMVKEKCFLNRLPMDNFARERLFDCAVGIDLVRPVRVDLAPCDPCEELIVVV